MPGIQQVHAKRRRGQKLRIDSSYIGMESARKYTSVKAASVKLGAARVTGGGLDQTDFGQLFNMDGNGESKDGAEEVHSRQNSLTNTGMTANSLQERFQSMSGVKRVSDREISSLIDQIREQCMRYIFELLFGKEKRSNKTSLFEEETSEQQSFEEWMQDTTGVGAAGNSVNTGAVMDVFSYEAEFVRTEQETTAFSTVGTVKTADGREINFNVDVEMSRSFTQYYKEQYQVSSVRVCDPLVINLDTDIAGLSDQKFFFDLDADGEKDEISMLHSSSGYLALDKNQDGTINDGSELFGTTSGDGFSDLQKYDEDGNGWIDEGDAIWDKLQIWCKGENGEDILYKLAERGIGAICLQRVGTQFSLNSLETNETNGYIRSTGVFLYENGTAGTVQHVDVAKSFQAVG